MEGKIENYHATCAALLDQLMAPCSHILQRQPPRQENVYLVLNVLAITVATILTTYEDHRMNQFFDCMMEHNIDAIQSARKHHRLH